MIRKIDFSDDLLPLLEAEAKRRKTTLSGYLNMRLADILGAESGPHPAPIQPRSSVEAPPQRPQSGPNPARTEAVDGPDPAREGDIGGVLVVPVLGGGSVVEPSSPPVGEVQEGRKPKRGRADPAPDTPPDLATPAWGTAVADWLAYKAEKGSRYKERGLQALFTQLRRYGPEIAIPAIQRAMASNWQGFQGYAEELTQKKPGDLLPFEQKPVDPWIFAVVEMYPPGEQRDRALSKMGRPLEPHEEAAIANHRKAAR
jgi:hypothetical protein